jgi:ATP-grasp domain
VIPKVLVFHTLNWPNAARVALAFRHSDCIVYALALRGHPLHRLSAVARGCTYRPFAPLRSLQGALATTDPDLIVLCDDGAVTQLLRLYYHMQESAQLARRIRALIERSLGNPDSYRLVAARSNLASIAASAGVSVPQTNVVSTLDEVEQWLGREGYPAVLKTDYSWGGRGVTVISSVQEAARAFRKAMGPLETARAVKRALWDREPELLRQRLHGRKPVLSLQRFVEGRPANYAVACWKGETMAGFGVEVLASLGATGNATVVRVVDNREMRETSSRVVRHLGISGFCGFDFILEKSTNRACLIEINPRATQINHLSLGPARDMPGALRARVANEPLREARAVTEGDTIALFPQELRRDPGSRFLLTAYHDVPDEAPELVQAYAAPSATNRAGSSEPPAPGAGQ